MTLREAESSLPVRHVASIPRGNEPQIQWNGEKGYVDSQFPIDPNQAADAAIWERIIEDWGIDPTTTEIVDGSVHIRVWDANVGNGQIERMHYYRAQIRSKRVTGDRADIEALCKIASKRRPPVKIAEENLAHRAFLILLSDWQIGKGEGGGTEATIERIKLSFYAAVEHIKSLIKSGRAPSAIYIAGMGDLIEQCTGNYAMQAFSVDLDRRSQMRVARRMILFLIDLLIDMFNIPIVCIAVPGNHGENRNASGKAYTTWTDNDDLAVFEQAGEICAANVERYGQVSFPQLDGLIEDDMTVTLELSGVPVSFAHGHQFGNGGTGSPINKIEKWLTGQVMGRQPVGQAAILFSGHYHHFCCSEGSGRTVFQCPAQDGGSKWFKQSTGKDSPAGMLCVGIGLGYGARGWGDLIIT